MENNKQIDIPIDYVDLRESIKKDQEIATRKETYKKNVIKNTLVGAAMLFMGAATTYVGGYISNEIKSNIEYSITDDAISKQVATSKDAPVGLVSKSVRISHDNNGNPIFYTDYEQVAMDVLLIDDQFFDSAYYNAYLHFKARDEISYITEMNFLTYYISLNANREKNSLAYARTSGCKSFQDYLSKNGFISEEAFEKFSEQAMSNYAEYLKENKGESR